MEALNTLGFQEYVADVEAVHKEYKEQASVRSHTRAALALEVSADSLFLSRTIGSTDLGILHTTAKSAESVHYWCVCVCVCMCAALHKNRDHHSLWCDLIQTSLIILNP